MLVSENRPTHPGEFIREDILVEFGLTQTELAERLGVSRRTVNQLVNQQRGISAEMAIRLGKFTNTTPQLWLESLHGFRGSFDELMARLEAGPPR